MSFSIECQSQTVALTQPTIMGVLNITPDSFSDGGRWKDCAHAVELTHRMVQDGARIIDVGAESTRPGSQALEGKEQIKRLKPVLEALGKSDLSSTLISVDTRSAEVANVALNLGAHIINDVSALSDPAMAACIARHKAAVILMHMRGQPENMQDHLTDYRDVVLEVKANLAKTIDVAVDKGIALNQILIDPGIGFGKGLEDNIQLTKHLRALSELGRPIVYGPSRKRFLGELTGLDIKDRDPATVAACLAATLTGAHVLRVHNVPLLTEALTVFKALTPPQ
jgi:dihydropteroate synthase